MKTVINIVLGLFLAGSLGLLFLAKGDNDELFRDVKSSKLKNDSLSMATALLQTNSEKFKRQADSLAEKNGELNKSLTQTNSKLAVRENEIRKTKKSQEETSKKYNDLLAAQKDRDKQIENLKSSSAQLQDENKNLGIKYDKLGETNNQLTNDLMNLKLSLKDNFLIEGLTKSGKLNNKGKKVRKIAVNFSTEAEIKNPSFRIFDPRGIQLPEANGSFNLQVVNDNSSQSPSQNKPVKIEITYSLSEKLGPGLYRLEMLSENKHAGNLLVRFR